MTVVTPIYTLNVFAEDDETPLFDVSTDPAHPRPFLKAFDNFPEQEIDFAKGAASIGQMNVQIVDVPDDPTDQDTGYLTGLLADPTGGSQLLGHRAQAVQNVGSGTEVVLDGVIVSVTLLDTFSTFELQLRDIRERERKAKAFTRTDTPTVLPPGVLNGYGFTAPTLAGTHTHPAPRTAPLTGLYVQRSSVQGMIHIETPATSLSRLTLTAPMAEAFNSTAPLQDTPEVVIFDRWKLLWRDAATGGAYTTIEKVAQRHGSVTTGVGPYFGVSTGRGLIGIDIGGRIQALAVNNVVSGGTLPSDQQTIEFIVQYDGPITKDWRLHLQGMTVGELLRNLYRGDYSDTDPRIRYDEAALLALTTPVRALIDKPVDDLREWTEKHAYPIALAAPTLDALGRISPVTYELPDATVELPELSDSNCAPAGGGWSHGSADAINWVRVAYMRDYGYDEGESDKILSVEAPPINARLDASIALIGEQKHEVSPLLLRAIGAATGGGPLTGDLVDETGFQVAVRIGHALTDRFALGGQYFTLKARRTDPDVEALQVGGFALVGVSWRPGFVG